LAFGVLVVTLVVAGSLWIMANINANMTLPRDLMDMHPAALIQKLGSISARFRRLHNAA
jgi:hypothetical protein